MLTQLPSAVKTKCHSMNQNLLNTKLKVKKEAELAFLNKYLEILIKKMLLSLDAYKNHRNLSYWFLVLSKILFCSLIWMRANKQLSLTQCRKKSLRQEAMWFKKETKEIACILFLRANLTALNLLMALINT